LDCPSVCAVSYREISREVEVSVQSVDERARYRLTLPLVLGGVELLLDAPSRSTLQPDPELLLPFHRRYYPYHHHQHHHQQQQV